MSMDSILEDIKMKLLTLTEYQEETIGRAKVLRDELVVAMEDVIFQRQVAIRSTENRYFLVAAVEMLYIYHAAHLHSTTEEEIFARSELEF
jgi:hypothetical protein